ncbi:MAG TPA: LLM class flavin-dependent oxidoreductase [Candidatus Binataceae bacterium]|jgi:probable F420-dependent oxidoreductase
MLRPGITVPLEPFHNRHLVELVRRAEELGYNDAWSAESFTTDAFSPLTAVAAVTKKMRLGTAIVPVFTRPPALIAMSSATVQMLSEGRFILGLGISTKTIVQRWMGVPFEKQVTRLKETVQALRAAFSREKVNLDGKTVKIDGFRLDLPMETPPPIYISAQGTQMLRIAGEIGDGLLTNFVTPEALPAMLKHVHEAARAAGKDPAKFDVVARIIAAVDEDADAAREVLRRSLTPYVTAPQYNKFFREYGFDQEAAEIIAAWDAGDRKKALQLIPDRMVESIFVFGTADQCRKRLDQFAAAGVKTSALMITSLAKTPEQRRAKIMHAIEALAPSSR